MKDHSKRDEIASRYSEIMHGLPDEEAHEVWAAVLAGRKPVDQRLAPYVAKLKALRDGETD